MPDASVDRKAVSGDDCSVEERGCRNNSSQDPAGGCPGLAIAELKTNSELNDRQKPCP